MSTTITEALQEIKTIGKRLEKKKQAVAQYLGRDSRVKDPLEKDGGSVEFIKRERQAIVDLETRIVDIRTKIQKANLETTINVNGTIKTISEWLTWRREVSSGSVAFLSALNSGIRQIRDKATKTGNRTVSSMAEPDAAPGDVVIHLNEQELLKEQENLETTLGDLDGKLSLLNAITIID